MAGSWTQPACLPAFESSRGNCTPEEEEKENNKKTKLKAHQTLPFPLHLRFCWFIYFNVCHFPSSLNQSTNVGGGINKLSFSPLLRHIITERAYWNWKLLLLLLLSYFYYYQRPFITLCCRMMYSTVVGVAAASAKVIIIITALCLFG